MTDEEHWPYGEPLPDPGIYERGVHTMSACNEPVDGGYCRVLVTSYDRGWWRWKTPANTHRGPHTRRRA